MVQKSFYVAASARREGAPASARKPFRAQNSLDSGGLIRHD
jgi:hypothetical protein